jgi:hypothetical protein
MSTVAHEALRDPSRVVMARLFKCGRLTLNRRDSRKKLAAKETHGRSPQKSGHRGFRPVVRVRDEECLQRLVGEQFAGSLEIVLDDEDLAPAAKGRAPEGPSRRYVGVTVEAVDALAAEETAKSLSRAFVRNDGQPHPFSHKLILALQPRNRLVEDLP